jgi:hypothetical protein
MRAPSPYSFVILAGGLSAVLACGDYGTSYTGGGGGHGSAILRIVQSASGPNSVQVRWNGQLIVGGLSPGGISSRLNVAAGTAAFELTPIGGGTPSSRTLTFEDGGTYTVVAQDSSGVILPQLVNDTNAIVAAGKSKLRVIHSATQAPAIDIYRTQPDFQTLITIMFPFDYQDVSPYLESDPGDWSIVVTPAGLTDTLFFTGPINVGSGKLVTVVVMDSTAAGGIRAVVVPDN